MGVKASGSQTRSKKMKKTVLCLIILASSQTLLVARSVHSTQATGLVESIDFKKREVAFKESSQKPVLYLQWDSSTEFVYEMKFVSAKALRENSEVEIWYHTPFFGKKYLRKVIWPIQKLIPLLPRRSGGGCPWCSREY